MGAPLEVSVAFMGRGAGFWLAVGCSAGVVLCGGTVAPDTVGAAAGLLAVPVPLCGGTVDGVVD